MASAVVGNISGQSFLATGSLDQTSAAELQLQAKALDDLLRLLLNAGYFRARIAALGAFDKVVGGLCWCITSSGIAVDVDVFYDEDQTLGQKIQLSEKIVKVLRTMGCPSPLQANQVTKGDHAAIFPVVRWLVTKVLEYRRVTGDYVRLSSEEAFDRTYAPFAPTAGLLGATASARTLAAVLRATSAAPPDGGGEPPASATAAAAKRAIAEALPEATRAGSAYASELLARYAPARRYRRGAASDAWKRGLVLPPPLLPSSAPSPAAAAASAMAAYTSCLLEFGEHTVRVREGAEEEGGGGGSGGGAPKKGGSAEERKGAAAGRAARAEEAERRRLALEMEAKLLKEMGGGGAGGGGSSGGGGGGGGAPGAGAGAPGAPGAAAAPASSAPASAAAAAAVSGANVGALLSLQGEELRRAAESYKATEEELRALALSSAANSKAGRAAAHARRLAALTARVAAGEEARAAAAAGVAGVEARGEALRAALIKCERRRCVAAGEVARLDGEIAALAPEQRSLLARLAALGGAVDTLRAQAAAFKAGAREQRASLAALLAALQEDNASGPVAARLAEVEAGRAERLARHAAARGALGERARLVARLARALEEYPGRGELSEYERRFGELAEVQGASLDENKKYYTRHKTLLRKQFFLAKESSIIQSLLEQFGEALKDKKGAAAYLAGVDKYLAGITATLAEERRSCSEKEAEAAARAGRLQELVGVGRRYARALKELQEEVEKNEAAVRGAAAAAAAQ